MADLITPNYAQRWAEIARAPIVRTLLDQTACLTSSAAVCVDVLLTMQRHAAVTERLLSEPQKGLTDVHCKLFLATVVERRCYWGEQRGVAGTVLLQ